MGSSRIARAAALQLLLFGCGVGLVAAARAGMVASAAVLGLVALWIGAAAAWQARLRPSAPAPPQPPSSPAAGEANLLASLLDQTPAPLVTRESSGRLLARNRAARRLFTTDGPLLAPPQALADALERGPTPRRITVEVGEGQVRRTYAVSLSEMLGAGGPLRMAALLDIEPELRAAEAAALRELLGVLSHEIMNGLTPVASLAATACELLATDEPGSREDARDAVDVLARRAEGLARFAQGYRALARLPPPQRRPVSMATLMAEASTLFRTRWSASGVVLTTEAPSPDILARVDPDQISQALLNLLANAAEAALEGGSPPCVALRATTTADGDLVLEVEDSGQGVPDELRERIGQPFFTTKPHGSGVGLSLARQIARAHGGELELRPPTALGGAVFAMIVSG
jgi:two-component system, NtrC family, nitrogen regulation sensor histidine kinase NtrY